MQYGGIGFISGSSVSDDVDLIMNNQHNNHKQSHRSSNHRRSNPPGTEQDPDEAHNNRHPAAPSSSSCSSTRPRPVAAGAGGAVPITVDEAIDRLGMGLFQYQIVLACGLCFMADAMEILLLSFLSVVLQSTWHLTEPQVEAIVSVVFVGAMVGTVVLSPLADRWGRQPIVTITATMIAVFGVATAFCASYPAILVARFLVGVGVGGLNVPYDALSEFMPSQCRGRNLLMVNIFWTAGSLSVPLFAWLTLGRDDRYRNEEDDESALPSSLSSWRSFVALCASPCIVATVLAILFVPESPRWLLSKGKHDKALRILRYAAAKNQKEPFLVFPEGTRLVDDKDDRDDNSDADNNVNIAIHSSNNSLNATEVVQEKASADTLFCIDSDEDEYEDENKTHDDDHHTELKGRQEERVYQFNDSDENKNHNSNAFENKNNCRNSMWRKIVVVLGGQWYGLAFMYYGTIIAVSIVFSNSSSLSSNSNTSRDGNTDNNSNNDDGGFNFDYMAIIITSSAETIGLIIAILIVDRIGRVRTQAWAYIAGGFCILILGLLDFYGTEQQQGAIVDAFNNHTISVSDSSYNDTIISAGSSSSSSSNADSQFNNEASLRRYLILFAFCSRMFIMTATCVTWLHTAELLPTENRATGHGLANAMGRIGGITCPFIISRDTSLRLIGLVMFSVGIITALFTSLLPETTGTALGKAMHSRGGSLSCDENTQIVQYEGKIGVNTTLINNDTDRVHNDENKEASGTRRCITSFEIT